MGRDRYPEPLGGPAMYIGFYWHDKCEVRSFREILKYLVDIGYSVHPDVAALSTLSSGKGAVLPDRIAGGGIKERKNCSLDDLLTNDDWIPICCQLIPPDSSLCRVDLEHAGTMLSQSPPGAKRVVVLILGGAEMQPDVDDQTTRCMNRLFREICNTLRPDYAGILCEFQLAPPPYISSDKPMIGLEALYLSRRLWNPIEAKPNLKGWGTEDLEEGVIIGYKNAWGERVEGELECVWRLLAEATAPLCRR